MNTPSENGDNNASPAPDETDHGLSISNELYRTLAESSPEMVYLLDRNGLVRYVNKAAKAMFSPSGDDVVGKNVRDIFPPAQGNRHLEAIASVIKTGALINSEVEAVFPTGRRWIDARLSPIRDRTGAITGVLGLSMDITERKKKEELLQVQRDLGIALSSTKNLIEGLKVCLDASIRISNMDSGGISLVNQGGDFDLYHHQGLSRSFIEKVTRVPVDSLRSHIIMSGKPVYLNAVDMPNPSRHDFQAEGLHAGAVIPFSHEGRVIGCLNIASHTLNEVPAQARPHLEIIAAQIGGEAGWLIAQNALQKSEVRYRQIVENINDGMIIHNFAGTILEVNENACLMHGYAHGEMVGMKIQSLTSPADRLLVQQRLVHLKKTGSLVFDGEHLRKDGSTIAINVSARIVSSERGGVVQSFFRDISALRKMEAEMGRQEKLAALGILAGGIAHDFNNLLSGVFGFMDLARMSMEPGAPALEYLNQAFTGFEGAKHLSQQLLTFAKGGTPVKRAVSVVDIVRESGTLALSGSNIRIIFEISDTISAIDADHNQLAQVFSNLLINARQAMPDGGTITVSAVNRDYNGTGVVPLPAGRYVVVAVQDEGIGIPEKIIDRIFDPFFTTKQQGSGLGLSICFSIVKKHSGHLAVESAPGAGSVFSVWLPATGARVPDVAAKPDLESLRGTGRILIMDDEPAIREMASSMLRSAGYEPVAVADGSIAIEKYRAALKEETPFDLAILDLTVPGGMGGEKTIIELKKINPGIAAVVSSGYSDSALLANFSEYGFDGTIAKPYAINELLKVVKKTIKSI